MRILIILSILLVGCKEGSSKVASAVGPINCVTVDPAATDIYESPSGDILIDSASIAVGDCIAIQGGYAWVQDAVQTQYHYAVNLTDGSLKESDALIFSDAACTQVVGEYYSYPLHLSNDVFVFSFEGNVYEYIVGALYSWASPGAYYGKVPGGSCDPVTVNAGEVRLIQPSGFNRTFTGAISL